METNKDIKNAKKHLRKFIGLICGISNPNEIPEPVVKTITLIILGMAFDKKIQSEVVSMATAIEVWLNKHADDKESNADIFLGGNDANS